MKQEVSRSAKKMQQKVKAANPERKMKVDSKVEESKEALIAANSMPAVPKKVKQQNFVPELNQNMQMMVQKRDSDDD